jgi:cyclopropane fatty-acyl-phospholipid synthase-like methyltransferase
VLRKGGRLAFFTIFIPEGLSPAAYRRALRSGPSAGGTRRRNHHDMLFSAGFRLLEETDLTADFLRTARAWFEGRRRYEGEMRAVLSAERYEEQQRDSETQIRAIEDGLLRRALFVCE